jgi:SAM-dependent methyltransferase
VENNEIKDGELECTHCYKVFKIENYILKFIDNNNYSESWGELWTETSDTIRDSSTGGSFYYDSIFGKYSEDNLNKKGYSVFGFEWKKNLKENRVLEIGAGTGVCTEHLVKTGAEIFCVDMSNAMETFPKSLKTLPNIHLIQADITTNFMKKNLFNYIWFFQVLQHTPNTKKTLSNVKEYLIKGGELSVTAYASSFYPWYHFITKHLTFTQVYWLVKIFLPVKYIGQKIFYNLNLTFFSRVWRYIFNFVDPRNIYFSTISGDLNDWPSGQMYNKNKDKRILFSLVVINTFDAITPNYTNGLTLEEMQKELEENEYKDIKVWGKAGTRAKAKR